MECIVLQNKNKYKIEKELIYGPLGKKQADFLGPMWVGPHLKNASSPRSLTREVWAIRILTVKESVKHSITWSLTLPIKNVAVQFTAIDTNRTKLGFRNNSEFEFTIITTTTPWTAKFANSKNWYAYPFPLTEQQFQFKQLVSTKKLKFYWFFFSQEVEHFEIREVLRCKLPIRLNFFFFFAFSFLFLFLVRCDFNLIDCVLCSTVYLFVLAMRQHN